MKKLLILAYDFPPYVSVGGLRPYSWYKYLHEFDVEPIVVTRQWSNAHGNALDYIAPGENPEVIVEQSERGTILRAPYFPSMSNRLLLKYGNKKFRRLRKILTAIDEIRQFICISGPKKTLYRAAYQYLQENQVDAIIATGEPFVLFYYAKRLSLQFNIPWIADYRDPWSQNEGRKINRMYHLWNQFLEKKIVATASRIITVSAFIQLKIEELVKNKEFTLLINGYDPEIIEEVAKIPQSSEQLTISFVGTIYQWHPWQSFVTAFSQYLETTDKKLRLHFYGLNIPDEVRAFVETLPAKTQAGIQIFLKMPNRELLEKIARENVMLLFNYYSYMGTKIFDYVGVKRKILLVYGNDPEALDLKKKYYKIEEHPLLSQSLQADLLRETQAGIVVEEEAQLPKIFTDLLNEFEETHQIACHSVATEQYSRKVQVKKLREVMSFE